MTRQKKEIIRKIEELNTAILVDEQLSCGCHPAGVYDDMYEQIYELEEQLARLSHYDSREEMLYDDRYVMNLMGDSMINGCIMMA